MAEEIGLPTRTDGLAMGLDVAIRTDYASHPGREDSWWSNPDRDGPYLSIHPVDGMLHVGDTVPSQQRKFPDGGGGGGAATTIEVVRCKDPQAPVAVSVIVSDPERVPV